MGIFEELKERGLIAQMTDEEKIKDLLNNHSATFYIGFDPTADSLHVGHFMQLTIMSRLQKAGHRPIALIGDGTGMVGDPSGRSDLRKVLTRETVEHNASRFKEQMSKFIDFEGGRALMINNGDWLLHLNYVDFLREIGTHFSVNKMLTAECFKVRLEKGLSFLEFNYMIMQSYDFLYLSRNFGCVMQCGGDDQWSNILGGIELIRRCDAKDAYGLTFKLLVTSDGRKMGKTQSGAVWLDRDKTSPYDFFQYWRNVDDRDVIRLLKMLSTLSLDEIKELEKLEGSGLNRAKEILAYNLTEHVHSKEDAEKALDASRSLFVSGSDSENIPSTEITRDMFTDGAISIIDLMTITSLSSSKSEARRVIEQGGVMIFDDKADLSTKIKEEDFKDGFVLIKKGKKTFHKAVLK